jgi:deoxyribonuclease-1
MKFVLPSLVALTCVFVSLTNTAAQASNSVPYYGHEFNQSKNQLKNEELKTKLREVLTSGHVSPVNPSEVQIDDQIVKSCDSIKNCKEQTSLGYDRARQYLFGTFYLVSANQGYGVKEMYCDRIYTAEDFKNGIGAPAPGIVPEGTVINTEHTWPQSRFTGKYPKDIQKADMHHLFPTDSQMNSLRGNTIFGEVTKDSNKTKCNASKYGPGLGASRDVFEPPQTHKGRVARALFYFSVRYELPISAAEEVVLKRWNHESPVDQQEILRNNEIFKLQGNRNPFIDYPELADQIQDF